MFVFKQNKMFRYLPVSPRGVMHVNFYSFRLNLSAILKSYISFTGKAERIVQGYGSQDFFSGIKSFPMFPQNLLNFEWARGLKSDWKSFRMFTVFLVFHKKVSILRRDTHYPLLNILNTTELQQVPVSITRECMRLWQMQGWCSFEQRQHFNLNIYRENQKGEIPAVWKENSTLW